MIAAASASGCSRSRHSSSVSAAGATLAGLPPEQRVAGLLVLTIMTGILMLLAGLLRAGALVRFISNAVMVGFMAGVAVQIVLGQLLPLTGFSSASTNRVARVADMVAHIGAIDLPTTAVGVATIVLIVLVSRTRLKLFAMVAALI